MARGNPFDREHEVEVVVNVPTADLELPEHLVTRLAHWAQEWNGELHLTSRRAPDRQHGPLVTAGGVPEPLAQEVAHTVVNLLLQRQETQHLYLDADRAYPPVQIEPHRYGEIWQQEWESPEFTRQWAHRPTRTFYPPVRRLPAVAAKLEVDPRMTESSDSSDRPPRTSSYRRTLKPTTTIPAAPTPPDQTPPHFAVSDFPIG